MNSRLVQDNLKEKADMLRIMGHPIRLAVLKLLLDKKELMVTDIHNTLEIEQAVASHHLRILKRGRVLDDRKDGKNMYYSLADDYIQTLMLALFE